MSACLCGCERKATVRGLSVACYRRIDRLGQLESIALPAKNNGGRGIKKQRRATVINPVTVVTPFRPDEEGYEYLLSPEARLRLELWREGRL